MKLRLTLLFVWCCVLTIEAYDNVLINGIYYTIDTRKQVAGIFWEPDLSEDQDIPEDEYGSICADTLFIPATVQYKNRRYRVTWGSSSGLLMIKESCVRTVVIGENISALYDEFFMGFNNVQTIIFNSSATDFKLDNPFPPSTQTIIFGDKVRNISPALCAGMTNLQTIIFPKRIEDIDTEAFAGCYHLENITIPETIQSISSDAFSGVLNVNDRRLPYVYANGLRYGWLEDGQMVYDIDADDLAEFYGSCVINGFGEYPFAFADTCKIELLGCSPAVKGTVRIPPSVRFIGPHAFNYCRNLKSVIVPDSVNTISVTAFSDVDTIYYNGPATGAPWGAKVILKGTDK